MLGGSRGYRRFVQDGLKDGHKEEYYAVEDQRFLGEEGFTKSMRADEEEEVPRLKRKSGVDAAVKKLSVRVRQLRYQHTRKLTASAPVLLVKRCGESSGPLQRHGCPL